jgi:hypothetical protein
MTLLRSYADDMILMDWQQNKIWPAEANLQVMMSIGAQSWLSLKMINPVLRLLPICISLWTELQRQFRKLASEHHFHEE